MKRLGMSLRGAALRYARPESIEMPFSKLKAFLRKAAERTIFQCTLAAHEARNYFRRKV